MDILLFVAVYLLGAYFGLIIGKHIGESQKRKEMLDHFDNYQRFTED